jgi:hypothetical protein
MQTGLHTRLISHLKPQVPPAGGGKYVGKVCSSPMRFREIERAYRHHSRHVVSEAEVKRSGPRTENCQTAHLPDL